MAVCWRCGVDWDDTDYLARVPCTDCQLEYPATEYRKLNVVREAERARRDDLVRLGWEDHQSDPQIADEIGLSKREVLRVRTRLGLAGHTDLGGTVNWSEGTVENLRQASRDYWADPENRAQPRDHGGAVSGRLSDPEPIREQKRQNYDAVVTGKAQTYKGNRSEKYFDQRIKSGGE